MHPVWYSVSTTNASLLTSASNTVTQKVIFVLVRTEKRQSTRILEHPQFCSVALALILFHNFVCHRCFWEIVFAEFSLFPENDIKMFFSSWSFVFPSGSNYPEGTWLPLGLRDSESFAATIYLPRNPLSQLQISGLSHASQRQCFQNWHCFRKVYFAHFQHVKDHQQMPLLLLTGPHWT